MTNFNFINIGDPGISGRLATGGDLRPDLDDALADLDSIVEAGITHILDVRVEYSDEEFVAQYAPRLRYLHHGVDDAGQRIADDWWDDGVDFVLAALQDPESKVLVHCHMGINRGPSLAYGALLALEFDPIEAIDAIRAARPIAGVGYAEQALDWSHGLLDRPSELCRYDQGRLAQWRHENWIDVVRIIRDQRSGGSQQGGTAAS